MSLQLAVDEVEGLPTEDKFEGWVGQALRLSNAELTDAACVTIRIVGSAESSELNDRYRQIERPTNVLAFPAGEIPFQPDEEEEEEAVGRSWAI